MKWKNRRRSTNVDERRGQRISGGSARGAGRKVVADSFTVPYEQL